MFPYSPPTQMKRKPLSYAIAVFDDVRPFRGYTRYLEAGLQVCSLVACTEYGSKDSCGRFAGRNDIQDERDTTFEQINLKLDTANAGQMIWVNTLAMDMLPFDVNDFEYNE